MNLFANDRNRGVTLIELTVAVMVSAVVISLIYTVWNHINRHTFVHQRRSALHLECSRIAEDLDSRLRRAEGVLQWDRNSIRFISAGSHDTIAYRYDGMTLFVNGLPAAISAAQTSVSLFSLENQNENSPSQPYLFRIAVALSNVQGESDTVSTTVMARRVTGLMPGNDFTW